MRAIKYVVPVEQGQVFDGIPLGFLPIIHHALLVYSPFVARFIAEKGFELQAKTDYRFMENTYKLLLNDFDGYKPQLTIQQFFANGFGECKIIMCVEIIALVKEKHRELLQADAKKHLKIPPTGAPAQGKAKSAQKPVYSLTNLQHTTSDSQFDGKGTPEASN